MTGRANPWRPIETRLLAEYLPIRFPGRRAIQNVRVGPLHPSLVQPGMDESELAAAGVWRRWVDAVVIDPPQVILIEAGVKPNPGKIGQLATYLELWPHTPEFAEYAAWPVRGHVVFAVDDGASRRLAARLGMTLEVFSPAWVSSYFQTLAPSKRRSPLDALPLSPPPAPP